MSKIINEYKEVSDCIDHFNNPTGDIKHCLRICYTQSKINQIPDNLNIFDIVQNIDDFFDNILKPLITKKEVKSVKSEEGESKKKSKSAYDMTFYPLT